METSLLASPGAGRGLLFFFDIHSLSCAETIHARLQLLSRGRKFILIERNQDAFYLILTNEYGFVSREFIGSCLRIERHGSVEDDILLPVAGSSQQLTGKELYVTIGGMSQPPHGLQKLSTAQVAALAGVHRDTLLRWLREHRIPEPARDRRGWRAFTPAEAEAVCRFAQAGTPPRVQESSSSYEAESEIRRLRGIDWDFADAKTSYLTHGIHPYPAKYIPQIPNALIQELSVVGERVADPFCGSGTTLVEALLLKRDAVGVDANPLACLITQVKTTRLSDADVGQLSELGQRADTFSQELSLRSSRSLFEGPSFVSSEPRPTDDAIGSWFDDHVTEELAEIRGWCRRISSDAARCLALVAFSSIIVGVSRQDSDTRYVRREKAISPGDTMRRFSRSLAESCKAVVELTDLVEPRFRADVLSGSVLDSPNIGTVDLVVCSPPYPNAYSYHLYHRTRMLWLEMDQPRFKDEEIGSHRKYSRKGPNAATAATFEREMSHTFGWLARHVRHDGYACFVVGDSTLAGKRVDNAAILARAARGQGFQEVARFRRRLKDRKKSFNPSIGKIKNECILVLRRSGEESR